MTSVDRRFEKELAEIRAFREEQRVLNANDPAALNGGGGGGTYDGMVPIKDYVDKADEAVETRLMAKLDTLATKAEVTSAAASQRTNIWGAALTTIGILLAVAAFAGDRFDAGIGAADARQAQLQRDQAQDAAAAANAKKLDELLRRIPAR